MKKTNLACVCTIISFGILFSTQSLLAQQQPANTSIFADKNLEAAVRKYVFDKRDNANPLTETDLATISTISAVGLQIKDLKGLEKCRALASLDVSRNEITNLEPIKDLAGIQFLNLAANQVEDIKPIGGIAALQYVELSGNHVKD